MDYASAIEFLYSLRLFGTKLGLENTHALAELCDQPHRDLRFIHVAGTNGKGSVCAMLESIYRAAGLRVGLFTSPHLVSFTERIQVDRACISPSDVSRLTESLLERFGPERDRWPFRPTFFEFVTAMGLLYFRERRCDLVIWETGMGGRLDATNIVTPLASIITNIQFDHQQWLGSTLAEISREKAGIIKPGVPIVTGVEAGEALAVIRATAATLHAPLTVIERPDPRLTDESLSLSGEHQRWNASVALATVDLLQPVIPVTSEVVQHGLSHTSWRGRLQKLQRGGTTILLDGAHNPAGARALARSLAELFPGEERTLILGLFKDKAWREICDFLVPGSSRLYLVPIQSERTVPPEELRKYCAEQWPDIPITLARSSEEALQRALQSPFVVIAGSLHLIGEALQNLAETPPEHSERGLNEWDAGRSKSTADHPNERSP